MFASWEKYIKIEPIKRFLHIKVRMQKDRD